MSARMMVVCGPLLTGALVLAGPVEPTVGTADQARPQAETAVAIGVDAAGNTYAASQAWGGSRAEGGSDWDILVAKHAPDGTPIWERRYDGPGHWCDTPTSIAVDDAGNAYVTGFLFESLDPERRFATHAGVIKFDPQGEVAWEVLYDAATHGGAGFRDLSTDQAGDIVAVGVISAPESQSRRTAFLTLKLSDSGEVLWTRQWGSTPIDDEGADGPQRVRIDAAGGVLVMGVAREGTTDGVSRPTVLRYTPEGALSWTYSLPQPGAQTPTDAASDDLGNIYLSGSLDTPTGPRALLVSLSPAGQERWSRLLEAPGGTWPDATSLSVGLDGLLYVGLDRPSADGSCTRAVSVRDTQGRPVDAWTYANDADPGAPADAPERASPPPPSGVDARSALGFANLWASRAPLADIDGDGRFTPADLVAFLDR